MQIIKCTVGLPGTTLPAWLESTHFELVTHIRDGVRLVDYNASHGMNLKGWDAVSEKFQKSVAGCLSKNQRQKVLALVSRLEQVPSAGELARNLRVD